MPRSFKGVPTYSVGLIGCGRVGALLEEDPLRHKPASHLGGIRKIPGKVKSISLCDIDEERLFHCRDHWDIPNIYTDYQELLQCEKPDIVVIATWTSTHREIACHAAERGVKGIVLEKPVASDLNAAREIINTCRRYGVKLVVNHERRWEGVYRKVRDIVVQQTLGPLKFIYANVLAQSSVKGDFETVLDGVGGGTLLHDGTHLVDMIRFFNGDIAVVNGHIQRESPEYAVETTATALMRAENGVNICLEAGGMREYFNFELDLQFAKGRIKIGNGIREYSISGKSSRYSGFRDLVKGVFPEAEVSGDVFSGGLLEVMKAIETGVEPESSGEDGLKAMEVIFAIYQSASLGGDTVVLPVEITEHPLKRIFRSSRLEVRNGS